MGAGQGSQNIFEEGNPILKNKLNLAVALLLAAGILLLGSIELAENLREPVISNCAIVHQAENKLAVPANFAFAVLGDNKGDEGTYSKILDDIEQDPEIAFAVHTGDLTRTSSRNEYGDIAELSCAHLQKPFLVIPGNHDIHNGGGQTFKDVIGPAYYEAKTAAAELIFLDTSTSSRMDDAQMRWLEGMLAGRKPGDQVLVFTHQPLYDPRKDSKPHCLSPKKADPLARLFEEYGVNYVFAGHIHGYFVGKWNNIPYAITGGAGAELQGSDPQAFFHNYLKVKVNGARIDVTVVPVRLSKSQDLLLGAREYVKREKIELALYLAVAVLALVLLLRARGKPRPSNIALT